MDEIADSGSRYTEYINNELLRNAQQAKVGGVPSSLVRIRAFMNLKFRKGSGKWTDSRFEVRLAGMMGVNSD